jgi:predicted membrane protein
MYNSHRDSSSVYGELAVIVLVLMLILAFFIVKAVVLIVRTFVRYYRHTRSLWIALAVFLASPLVSGVLYYLTNFDGAFALVGITLVVLMITCLVVTLKNRDTLLRQNVNLIDEVLHASWFGSEDTPKVVHEYEQLAA